MFCYMASFMQGDCSILYELLVISLIKQRGEIHGLGPMFTPQLENWSGYR